VSAPEASILTIGYGQRDREEFLRLLAEHQVQYLGDVRRSPYSRYNPDFSREPMRTWLREAGITYVFLGDTLGGAPDDPEVRLAPRGSNATGVKVDYERMRELPAFQRGMERLRTASRQGVRLALMCSEGKPELCHRARLIGVALAAEEIPVAHIDEAGVLRSQEEVMLRIDNGQGLLPGFGTSAKASRSSRVWRVRDKE
jgi:uncharacterized protein (DUF488 family)